MGQGYNNLVEGLRKKQLDAGAAGGNRGAGCADAIE
jgi:hypothetical protein